MNALLTRTVVRASQNMSKNLTTSTTSSSTSSSTSASALPKVAAVGAAAVATVAYGAHKVSQEEIFLTINFPKPQSA